MSGLEWVFNHPSASLLAVIGFTSALAGIIHAAIPLLAMHAQNIRNAREIEIVRVLAIDVEWLIGFLDVVKRCLPHVVVGPLPSTQPIATSLAPFPMIRALSVPPIQIPPPIGKP